MIFKKPKFWDLKKPNFLAYLLLPFSIILELNNLMNKLISKKKFDKIKTICIGNIYLGGTGKTPTTIKIYNLLKKDNLKIKTAKKHYPSQIDEEILLREKSEFITSKNRSNIIKTGIKLNYDLIIFDDGLQEKQIDYDIKFVCFDSQNWVGNGFLIPSGPLRENLKSLKNYDGVFIKCSSNTKNLDEIYSIIKNLNPNIKVFHSNIIVKNLEKFDLSKKYLAFSGIGNNKSFREVLAKNKFNIIEEISFADHYNYKNEDISHILERAKNLNADILTTEKDYVKIPINFKKDIKFLKIDLHIIEEKELIKFIKSKIYETY
ncbi:tetraacyldisaccharide 4'-kinase [Pelagibacterales bacterium SAG-MED13]|nr:tetraacyldisaccharide 4'-kinase [Pelagibacterales bacterium SAG-MED13]|tara:strand:- start:292 stop:1248 length:957 start_codon:yes stop_codon:yes gene_type:complete